MYNSPKTIESAFKVLLEESYQQITWLNPKISGEGSILILL